MRTITDDQRRARLATRHALAKRVGTVEEAVESVTCLHATEAPTVYLSVVSRSDATRADIDRALYTDRSVVKQLAMRRTLFTFPRDVLPEVWGSASRPRGPGAAHADGQGDRGARHRQARRGLAQPDVRHDPADPGRGRAVHHRRAARGDPAARATCWSWRRASPTAAASRSRPACSARWRARAGVLRGSNEGDWRTSRPRWTLTEEWLGEPVTKTAPDAGYLELVRRWLRSFGPGTEDDLVWWLGATKSAVRRALGDLDAVEVTLVARRPATCCPTTSTTCPEPEPWAALLPVLDPTTMGWKHRDFYLDPEDRPYLFDTNGNGGTTAWWCGRIVGCWVQDPDGVVVVVPRGDVGAEALAALQVEAERLTTWLDGAKVSTVYASLQMKSARLP